jgi:hypothetical protein
MSPVERTAWIRLVSILIVFVPYFGFVSLLFAHGDALAKPLYVAFVVAAVLHGLVNGIAQIAAQAVFGKEVIDERDRAIEALSLRIAYYTLISLVLGALGTLATLGFLTPPGPTGKIAVPTFIVTSQFVFCCVVIAELSRHLTQVFCYRKEAWA